MIRFCLFVLFAGFHSTWVRAENWNGWRGPRGDGSSLETRVPTRWNGTTGEGIAWKTVLPGKGHSSPIVWKDRVFVTCCDEERHERLLVCFDRSNGKLQWKTTVLSTDLESKHQLNSYASGTPATDGESVYVSFLASDGTEEPAKNVGQARTIKTGKMIVGCYDMQGNERWVRNLGHFSSAHGFCSCPIIHRELLIVNGDHDGDSNVFGLNKHTGVVAWSFPREHQTRSYCTPIVRDVAGKTQLVMSGSKQVISLDPMTGKRNWYVDGPTEQFVASMVFDGTKFYLTAGFPDYYVMGIYPDGTGNVTKSKVAWSSTEAKCYVPSPVLVGDRLFVVDDRGTLNSFDTQQGTRQWQARLGGHHSASLVTANGLVYCTSDDGIVRIVKPGDAMEVVNENPLGENVFSSPAISQGQLFFRGETHLIAVGKMEGTE